MAGAGSVLGKIRPKFAELEGKDGVAHVLHLSTGPHKDDYKGMRRREAG